MARTDMANYLRLASETISRVLRRFQKDGLVLVNRRELDIQDLPRLQELAKSVLRD
jgi:CRP/FNR family transcriptional regulator